jgi:hypothetical protein
MKELSDEIIEAMANFAEAAGHRRDARLLRFALRMRQCPRLDLDELSRELGIGQ